MQINLSLDVKKESGLLLYPNLPKPLHGVNPRSIMGQAWWDKTRKEVYESNNFHCLACGINKSDEHILWKNWLEAHEVYDIDYEKKLATFVRIVPLCQCCHMGIHTGRLTAIYDKGFISEEDCWLVFERKKQVCGSYGKVDNRDYREEWCDWRLSFNGKLYEPKFECYEDWKLFYKGDE